MGCKSEAQNGFDEWMWRLDRTLYGRAIFEDYPRLDVRHLNRVGLLHGAHRIEWSDGSSAELDANEDGLTIVHRTVSYPRDLDDQLGLTWTPCNFGASRPWFVCPKCGTRAAVLSAFPRFRCRVCHPLVYASTHRSEHWQPKPVVMVLMI